MKYLLVVLSTLLFVSGCAGSDTPIAEGGKTTEVVIAEPGAADEAQASDQPKNAQTKDSESEDSESKDSESEDSEAEDSEASKEDDAVGLDQENVKLVVNDQKTAGQIIVKTVATARDGWVSVHKSKADGSIQQPDSIGEARVDSGDSEGIVVDLWEAPAVGDKLWVLLHVDEGERGTYEYPGKDAAVQKDGETMARSFVIKSEKAEKQHEESDE